MTSYKRITEQGVRDRIAWYYQATSHDRQRWDASFSKASLSHSLYRITSPKGREFYDHDGATPGYNSTAWRMVKGYQGAGVLWISAQADRRLGALDMAEILNAYTDMPRELARDASLTLDDVRAFIVPRFYDLFSGPEWASMAGQEEEV